MVERDWPPGLVVVGGTDVVAFLDWVTTVGGSEIDKNFKNIIHKFLIREQFDIILPPFQIFFPDPNFCLMLEKLIYFNQICKFIVTLKDETTDSLCNNWWNPSEIDVWFDWSRRIGSQCRTHRLGSVSPSHRRPWKTGRNPISCRSTVSGKTRQAGSTVAPLHRSSQSYLAGENNYL